MSDLDSELKELQKEEERLARRKENIQKKIEEQKKYEAKLDQLFAESGFDTPKDLIRALIEKYNVRVTAKLGQKKTTSGGTRKRTRVTAALRNSIKRDVEGGMSKNQASKNYDVSYVVVSKIMKGEYDHL